MSVFSIVLHNRNLSYHNGNALWQYNLSEDEFKDLKKSFTYITGSHRLIERDCALYFSEWWKRYYIGGKASKELIYQSLELENPRFTVEDFYEAAKEGGNRFGFKWLKNRNTLYFKTLLLQGGLPLKQIKSHESNYRRFLEEIIKLNPVSVDEFSDLDHIVSILPISSQNDLIYESCLQIVRSILDDDQNSILAYSQNSELKNITDSLIKKRGVKRLQNSKIKFSYRLNIQDETPSLVLKVGVPKVINSEDLIKSLNIRDEDEPSNEYNLFINSVFIAKFIRRKDNRYIVNLRKNYVILIDELHPEIIIYNSRGDKYSLDTLIEKKLQFHLPTLWRKSIDNGELILEGGRTTSSQEGYLLVPQEFKCDENAKAVNILNFSEFSMRLVQFSNLTRIYTKEESFSFYTNKPSSFSWDIVSTSPKWIKGASLIVVRDKISIVCYDSEFNRIPEIKIWYKSNQQWILYKSNDSLPIGVVDLKIQSKEDLGFDRVFNVGSFDIDFKLDYFTPCLDIQGDTAFSMEAYSSELYDFVIEKKSVCFTLLNKAKLPTSIKVRLSVPNQVKGVVLNLISPFQDIQIVGNNDAVLQQSVITMDNLSGYRLVSNFLDKDLEVVIFNKLNPKLRIKKKILNNIISLQCYQSCFTQLFRLHDITDKDNVLEMQVIDVDICYTEKIIKKYEVRQFSSIVHCETIKDQEFLILDELESFYSDLYVIPLDCEAEYLDVFAVNHLSDKTYYVNTDCGSNFILFSKDNSELKVHPCYISYDGHQEYFIELNRKKRISDFHEQLLLQGFESEVWTKFLVYYYLCQENNLPFSTFDILKSTTSSPDLAAKVFCFLTEKLDMLEFNFSGNDFLVFESDLGFSFSWIPVNSWEKIGNSIDKFPMEGFLRMLDIMSCKFFMTGDVIKLSSLNQEFNQVRSRFSKRVETELPLFDIGLLEKQYLNKLPKYDNKHNLNLLACYPMLIILSVLQKDMKLWKFENENLRRNILYLMKLDTQWYKTAINYYYNILN